MSLHLPSLEHGKPEKKKSDLRDYWNSTNNEGWTEQFILLEYMILIIGDSVLSPV